MRDRAKKLVLHEDPVSVVTARIWHCNYADLEPLRPCVALERLVVATYSASSLELVSSFSRLRALRILHLPKVHDLTPLGRLRELETLSLETLPSWDASRKRTTVTGLETLATLPRLRWLALYGVVPIDGSLAPLEGSTSLRGARFSGSPAPEIERFHARTGIASELPPEASADTGMPAPPLHVGPI